MKQLPPLLLLLALIAIGCVVIDSLPVHALINHNVHTPIYLYVLDARRYSALRKLFIMRRP